MTSKVDHFSKSISLCNFLRILLVIGIGIVISAILLIVSVLVSFDRKISLNFITELSCSKIIDGGFGSDTEDNEFLNQAMQSYNQ